MFYWVLSEGWECVFTIPVRVGGSLGGEGREGRMEGGREGGRRGREGGREGGGCVSNNKLICAYK